MERQRKELFASNTIGNGDRVSFKGEEFIVVRNRLPTNNLLGEVIIFKHTENGAKVVFLNSTNGLRKISNMDVI